MRVVEYTPDHAEALAAALARADFAAPLLRSPSYVRHYFLGHPACRLNLLVDDNGRIAATLGSEQVGLSIAGRRRDAAVLSNTYSFRAGAFPFLFLHWMKSTPTGVTFPGNALMNELVSRQKRWRAMHGLFTYWLNWDYPDMRDDALWKSALKPIARRVMRIDAARLAHRARRAMPDLAVDEEHAFDAAMAAPGGEFGLRLEVDAAHLNWRFDTSLDYVRYRVFRMRRAGDTCGSVVLAEWPHCVVVSHCDGADPELIALGVAHAVALVNRGSARHRKVLLTCMHAAMSRHFETLGFRPKKSETPFFLAAFDATPVPEAAHDDWLVNMDLSDGGLTTGMVYR